MLSGYVCACASYFSGRVSNTEIYAQRDLWKQLGLLVMLAHICLSSCSRCRVNAMSDASTSLRKAQFPLHLQHHREYGTLKLLSLRNDLLHYSARHSCNGESVAVHCFTSRRCKFFCLSHRRDLYDTCFISCLNSSPAISTALTESGIDDATGSSVGSWVTLGPFSVAFSSLFLS